jgi:hypothetical protein
MKVCFIQLGHVRAGLTYRSNVGLTSGRLTDQVADMSQRASQASG